MFDFDIAITGQADLLDRMAKLPDKLQKKSAVRAARAAMKIGRNAAVANAKQFDDANSKEAVWKNVSVQNSARGGRRVGGVVMRLGIRGGAVKKLGDPTNPGGNTWYWRFLELGTSKMAKQEFLVIAVMNNAQRIEEVLAQNLESELAKAVSQ